MGLYITGTGKCRTAEKKRVGNGEVSDRLKINICRTKSVLSALYNIYKRQMGGIARKERNMRKCEANIRKVFIGVAVAMAVIFPTVFGIPGSISSAKGMSDKYDTEDRDVITLDLETGGELLLIPAEEDLEEAHGPGNYGDWIGDYRKVGEPACSISVKEADESGFLFSVEYPGAAALVDINDCTATWVDESTAVYRGGDYAITFILTDDGTLQLAEIALILQDCLNIAGEYMLTE